MKRPLDIWLVTIGEPLPVEPESRPLRTRLLARELAAQGHRVRWWTSDFNHFLKVYHPASAQHVDSNEGYELSFLHGRAYRRNLSVARQVNHVQIARHFSRTATDMPVPDVIACGFPSIELAAAVSRYASERRIPLLVDIRDLWPDEMVNRLPVSLRGLAHLATAPLAGIVGRIMARADALLGVSARYLEWGLAHARRSASVSDAVLPLGYPDHPGAAAMRIDRINGNGRNTPQQARRCTFLFSGSFNQSVDLGSFIAAFRANCDPALKAVLCGDGENMGVWRAAAQGDSRIVLPGWCTADQIRSYAREADVGLVCYRSGSLVAMPNKLFEYMSFGLPVINSITGEAARLVDSDGIGINYVAGDVSSLARVLAQMAESANLRRECGRAAVRLFEAHYASSRVIGDYATRLEALADAR